MVKFYKRVDRNKRSDVFDTSVSTFYSDLPEGKETNLTVRSGFYNDMALFDFPVPHPPSYGSGELSGFSFEFKMDDTAIDGMDYAGPFDIHLMKKNQELGDEEGTVSRITDSNNVFAPAAVISAYHEGYYNDPKNCYMETFSNAKPDTIVYSKGPTIYHEDFHYLTLKDAKDALGYLTESNTWSDLELDGFSDYTIIHPETGQEVVPIEQKDEGKWISSADTGYIGILPFYEESSYWNLSIGEKGIKDKIGHFSSETAESITNEQNGFHEVTTSDTFFNVISTNNNVIKPNDAISSNTSVYQYENSDTVFHAYTGLNFTTDISRTSGTSLEMKACIDFDSAKAATSQETYSYGNGYDRQSIFACYKNVPMPVDFFDDLNHASYSRTAAPPSTLQEIDIDIYFDEMAGVYVLDGNKTSPIHVASDSSAGNNTNNDVFTHLRSFCITFSEKIPNAKADFGDFIHSHTDGSGDKDLGAVADITDNIMGVMFYLVPSASLGVNETKIRIKTLSGAGEGAPTDNVDNVYYDAETDGSNFDNKSVLGWTTHAGNSEYALSTGKWYRLKFVYSHNGKNGIQNDNDGDAAGGNMNLFICDPETGELAIEDGAGGITSNAYSSPVIIKNCNVNLTDRCNSVWPRHMTLWLNNIGNQYQGTEDLRYNHTSFPTIPKYAASRVLIDRIAFKNQNLLHSNMGGENNPNYTSFTGKIICNNQTLRQPGNFDDPDNTVLAQPPTGLALGFSDRTQLQNANKWLLFNGFQSSDTTNATSLTDGNLFAGYHDAAIPSRMGDIAYNIGSDPSDVLDSITIGADLNIKTGDGVNADPLQDVDGFSQKGIVKITSSAITTWDADADLRECLWASARILDAEEITNDRARLYVDDPKVLSMPLGVNFRIYKVLGQLATASNYSDVTISTIDENHIVVSRVSGTALDTLIQNTSSTSTLSDLFISPLLYWLLIMTSSDGSLPERSYKSVCLLDDDLDTTGGGLGLGATYNERSFASSSGLTNYTKLRSLNISAKPAFDIDIDYGFGTFKDDQTGYAAQFVPSLGTNFVEFGKNIQEQRKYESGDRFCFLIKPSEVNSRRDYRMIINSSDHGTTTNRPILYAHFEDKVPKIKDFKLSPNEENPQHIDFEWTVEDDDLWYGLLLIDNEQINSQYHGAIAHIPLNEVDNNVGYLYYPDQGDRYTDGLGASAEVTGSVTATVTSERDGLAGYCKRFDATDGLLTFATSGTLTDPTNKMTFIAHCIPEYVSSSQSRNLFFRSGFLVVTLESSSNGTFVQAVVTNSNGDSYTLKSPYVYTDGETPHAIIVTYDQDLPSRGVKLFLNGNLADSRDIGNYTLAANNNSILVGNDDNADNDAFNGRIEEIVLYNKCYEVINPQNKKFTYVRPLPDGETNVTTASGTGSPQNYCARLFLKDYHNIRGYTSNDVGTSSQLAILKTAFALNDT